MKELYWWGELVGTIDGDGHARIDKDAHPQAWCAAQYPNAPGFSIREHKEDLIGGQFVTLVHTDDTTMLEVL